MKQKVKKKKNKKQLLLFASITYIVECIIKHVYQIIKRLIWQFILRQPSYLISKSSLLLAPCGNSHYHRLLEIGSSACTFERTWSHLHLLIYDIRWILYRLIIIDKWHHAIEFIKITLFVSIINSRTKSNTFSSAIHITSF